LLQIFLQCTFNAPEVKLKEVAKYRQCFVCGDENSHGLQARFFVREDGAVITEYTVDERFVGYAKVLHGGILASLLDEVMIKAVLKDDVIAVTASMDIKFKKPVYVGQTIKLAGWIVQGKGRVFRTEGLAEVDGTVVASATGTYIQARGELADLLSESLE
jgi:uncharacterized protein (TIGR00369 family)